MGVLPLAVDRDQIGRIKGDPGGLGRVRATLSDSMERTVCGRDPGGANPSADPSPASAILCPGCDRRRLQRISSFPRERFAETLRSKPFRHLQMDRKQLLCDL